MKEIMRGGLRFPLEKDDHEIPPELGEMRVLPDVQQ